MVGLADQDEPAKPDITPLTVSGCMTVAGSSHGRPDG